MPLAIRHLIRRWKIRLADWFRFSRAVRRVLYAVKVRGGPAVRSGDVEGAVARIDRLCAAARLAGTEEQILEVEKRIAAVEIDAVGAARLLASGSDGAIRKGVILKPYDGETGEPGVVFISFEYEWAKLLACPRLEEFSRRYLLVVSPTWTPPHSTLNCLFPRIYPGPVYCLISNDSDLETFPRLSEKYRMVDLLASQWVDPGVLVPRPRAERDIDLVMLANFGTYKRHHVLFRALRDLPREWKVVLVGQPNGERTAEVLLSEAEAFGVRDRFELRERVSDAEVAELLCRARMSLICSKREGSCVAVVESMFADTPVALLEGAQVGSAKFIRAETGAFVRESRLAEDLVELHRSGERCRPRAWCLENGIDARSSSARLNAVLAEDCGRRGILWTRDIAPMCWHPNPMVLRPEDAPWSEGERDRVFELTGIRIGCGD